MLYKEAESLTSGFTIVNEYEIIENQVIFTLQDLASKMRYSTLRQLENKHGRTLTSDYIEFSTSNYYSKKGKESVSISHATMGSWQKCL